MKPTLTFTGPFKGPEKDSLEHYTLAATLGDKKYIQNMVVSKDGNAVPLQLISSLKQLAGTMEREHYYDQGHRQGVEDGKSQTSNPR